MVGRDGDGHSGGVVVARLSSQQRPSGLCERDLPSMRMVDGWMDDGRVSSSRAAVVGRIRLRTRVVVVGPWGGPEKLSCFLPSGRVALSFLSIAAQRRLSGLFFLVHLLRFTSISSCLAPPSICPPSGRLPAYETLTNHPTTVRTHPNLPYSVTWPRRAPHPSPLARNVLRRPCLGLTDPMWRRVSFLVLSCLALAAKTA
ncbi:hypothetical protein IWZ03DRAFT_364911 [Phyllosticta citriasiana]|uniref:Uncharacterized protein n=1 Tax=Phyllosticta citriasiana TaxID=595635 RepID=A0ABR1L009_9PEZI